MSPRPVAVSLLLLGVLLAGAPRAEADLTAFLGSNTTPTNRPVRGLAVGMSLLVVGLEFEYSDTKADERGIGRRHAGMFNVLAQTPSLYGLQFYATVGAGLYREEGAALLETSTGTNTGGGVKVGLVGPLRVRFDYRVFQLRGESSPNKTHHRFYTGVNLAF
jgi:hypothetical protein